MPNDNTLGAPTEGLGQKVTFAFDPASGGVPQLDLGGNSDIHAGLKGNLGTSMGVVQGQGVQAPPNPTLDILTKFGDAILRPKIEQAKQDAFFTGMQRAMQGEAVADIAKDQPWYSTIFGESDVVEGARAYKGSTVASTTVTALEEQMPELRKLGPAEVQKRFHATVQGAMTGDRPTDAAVLRSLTSQLPSLMRRQAKEHYGWLQENAAEQESSAFKAGASRLQAAGKGLADRVTTPDEFDAITADFVRSVAPAMGRDEKNYKESMKDNLVSWAKGGQFHALNALKKSGFLEVLTTDQQEAVAAAEKAGNAKLRAEYNVRWNDQWIAIRQAAEMPPEGTSMNDLKATIDAANEKYMAETGSSEGWLSPSERAAYISHNGIVIAKEVNRQADRAMAEAERLRAAGNKVEAGQGEERMVVHMATNGQLGALASNKGWSNDKIDSLWMPQWLKMSGDQPSGHLSKEQIQNLVSNAGTNYKIKPVEDYLVGQVTAALSAGELTKEVETVFKNYAALQGASPATADMYYGKYASQMAGYLNSTLRNGASPLGAFNEWFLAPKKRATLDKKEMEQAVAVIGEDTGWFHRTFMGASKIKPGSARRMAIEMADGIEEFTPATGSVADATKRVMKSRIGRDFEMLGGYFMPIMKGQSSLKDFLLKASPGGDKAVPDDKLNEVFEGAVKELLYGGESTGILPDEASDIFVGRLPDAHGVPLLRIQSIVDGKAYNAVLSGADVFNYHEQFKKRKANSTMGISNDSLRFGPALTFPVIPNGQPSIYAPASKWEAYRADQKPK